MICGDKEQLAIAKKEAEVMVRPPATLAHSAMTLAVLHRLLRFVCDSCVMVGWQRLLSPHPNIVCDGV